MKNPILPTFLALVIASSVFAGPLGGGGGMRSAPQARSGSRTAGQNMSEQQKSNVQKLQSDLAAIKAGSNVTDAQKQDLKNSLVALADGATKPSEESVTALANSLSAAFADKTLTTPEKAQITKNVEAVLKSANIPQSEVEALAASAQAVLIASGVSKADAQTVANDLRAISAELKAKAAAVRSKTSDAKTSRSGN
jgi:hypothetical protein